MMRIFIILSMLLSLAAYANEQTAFATNHIKAATYKQEVYLDKIMPMAVLLAGQTNELWKK